jgi:hypothetical protein
MENRENQKMEGISTKRREKRDKEHSDYRKKDKLMEQTGTAELETQCWERAVIMLSKMKSSSKAERC